MKKSLAAAAAAATLTLLAPGGLAHAAPLATFTQADLPYPAYGPADNQLCSIFNACRRAGFEVGA